MEPTCQTPLQPSLWRRVQKVISDMLNPYDEIQQLAETCLPINLSLPDSCNSEDVIAWNQFGAVNHLGMPSRKVELLGWRWHIDCYSSFHLAIPELTTLVRHRVEKHFSLDIRDVFGLYASKENLSTFATLDDMAESTYVNLIESPSMELLQKNLAWDQVRINKESNTDYFEWYSWVDRIYLINGGGSHHFAAARHNAKELQTPVTLTGKLNAYFFDPSAVNELTAQYEIFAISGHHEALNGLMDSMRNLRATYLWQHLPRPFNQHRALFLPKAKSPLGVGSVPAKTAAIADILRLAGVTDIGGYLKATAAQQRTSPPQLP